jgi:hypothetical protein
VRGNAMRGHNRGWPASGGCGHFLDSQYIMKTQVLVAAALLAIGSSNAMAAAGKSCSELKAEIAAKLDANHVSGYSLDIVENDKVADRKVLGSCEHGSKKIVMTTTARK